MSEVLDREFEKLKAKLFSRYTPEQLRIRLETERRTPGHRSLSTDPLPFDGIEFALDLPGERLLKISHHSGNTYTILIWYGNEGPGFPARTRLAGDCQIFALDQKVKRFIDIIVLE